jgi:lipoic acid synthetase
MRDLRAHDIEMLTIGQYLAPSRPPPAGAALRAPGCLSPCTSARPAMGFTHAAVGAAGA